MKNSEEEQVISQLLQISREKIAQGKGQDALSAVLNAIMVNSGEESVMRILDEAHRRAKKEKEQELRHAAHQTCVDLVNQDTLLSEMGDEDILIDAFQDGSSVICQRCHGLVAVERAEAHSKYWCSAIIKTEGSDEDEDD